MLEGDPSLIHAYDREATPLHVASAVRSPELVGWLLEHGADVNRRGKDNRTPLDLAAGVRKPIRAEEFAAVAAMLRRSGAELTPRAAAALGEADWLRTRHAEGTPGEPDHLGGGRAPDGRGEAQPARHTRVAPGIRL